MSKQFISTMEITFPLDLNSTPPEELDNRIISGEADVVDEAGNASYQAEEGIDITHAEECNPYVAEEGIDITQDEESNPHVEAAEENEIIPGEDAMAEDEGSPHTEAAGFSLDLNSIPAELFGEIIHGGGNDMDQDEGIALVQEEGNAIAEATGVQEPQIRPNKWLTDAQRYAAYTALHAKSRNGKLPKNATKEVAAFFQSHIRVIQKIWKNAREQIALGLEVDVSNRKTGRCGRKKSEVDLSRIATIPLNRRSTLRSIAKSLDVGVSTLHRKFKLGLIRRHTNTLKPMLRDNNKRDRLKFCLSMLDQSTLGDTEIRFIGMHNTVHMYEKWYYMTKKSRKYYLLPEEDDPERTIQNKNNIGKVMILIVVARPRRDAQQNVRFSGKIGVWAFVKEVPAVRKSRNRERGTLETKSVIANREVMRQYLIEKVIPAIKSMWPQDAIHETIFIQQDNARTHVTPKETGHNGLCCPGKQPSDCNQFDNF